MLTQKASATETATAPPGAKERTMKAAGEAIKEVPGMGGSKGDSLVQKKDYRK